MRAGNGERSSAEHKRPRLISMANESKTPAGEKKSNLTPIIIIAVIFAVTIGVIYAIISSGGSEEQPAAGNTASARARA